MRYPSIYSSNVFGRHGYVGSNFRAAAARFRRVAVVCVDDDRFSLVITFRKYDNDSDARQRGTFERVSARQLWVGNCQMVAITSNGSALHVAAPNAPPAGSLRLRRREELRQALASIGLGWLYERLLDCSVTPLSLNALASKTIAQLRQKGVLRSEPSASVRASLR